MEKSYRKRRICNNREKLINIAEKLFAEKGYHGAGVREITSKAGVNTSAISYYFGSKKNLYLTIFKERFIPHILEVRKEFKSRLQEKDFSLEEVIKHFVESIFFSFSSETDRKNLFTLLVRELTYPSEAIEIVFEQGFKPLLKELAVTISSLVNVDKTKLYLGLFSILGQLIHFHFFKIFIEKFLEREYDENLKKEIVSHIVKFSLKGLEGL